MDIDRFQTSLADLRGGWRYFRAWRKQFWLSTRRLEPKTWQDILYLVDELQIRTLELEEETEPTIKLEEVGVQKVKFMQAYLSIVAIDSHNFETQTRSLLDLQKRRQASTSFGFWFWQNELEKFGPGVSSFFQGSRVSISCKEPKQIDFASVSAVLPFDSVLVRNPRKPWNRQTAKRLIQRFTSDIGFDGVATHLDYNTEREFLEIWLQSPDYGRVLTSNSLRAWRATELCHSVVPVDSTWPAKATKSFVNSKKDSDW
jgi:hypothetical protein